MLAKRYSEAAAVSLLAITISISKCHVSHGFIGSKPKQVPKYSPLRLMLEAEEILPSFFTSFHGNSLMLPNLFQSPNEMLLPPSVASSWWSSSNMLAATSERIISDPKLEAELLTDVAHVAIDVTTFVAPANTLWLRFCNLFGRLLIIFSDYIPDNSIGLDECLFQSFMLAVSANMFVKSARPVVQMALSRNSLTERDWRAFSALFGSRGVTVLQFKTLLSSGALQWVEAPAGEELQFHRDGAQDLYWLHSGELILSNPGNDDIVPSKTVVSADCPKQEQGRGVSERIFGVVQFANALEQFMHDQQNQNDGHNLQIADTTHTTSTISGPQTSSPNIKLVSGSRGATMLRISTHKLFTIMNDDDHLANCIHRLVLSCMQEKLLMTDMTTATTAAVAAAAAERRNFPVPTTTSK